MKTQWELSYYIAPIGWNGKRLTFDEKKANEEFRTLREAGVRWAGFNGAGSIEKAAFDFPAAVSSISTMMRDHGIRLSSFHYAGPTIADPAGSQERVRETMFKDIATFAPWRPKAFVVHPWWPLIRAAGDPLGLKPYWLWTRRRGFETLIETIAGNLKLMAKAAARHSIRLALETMGKFAPPPGKYLPRLVELIDEPNVGYCLDAGHVHACGESVVEWVRRCGGKLFETHFHDNRGLGAGEKGAFIRPKDYDEHLSPGLGTIPWIDVINALVATKFQGPVTFETSGWPHMVPSEGYAHAIAWWRTCEAVAKEKRGKGGCH